MLTVGMLFWILYIIGIVVLGYRSYPTRTYDWLFWWVLIGLLGIGTFGSPIK